MTVADLRYGSLDRWIAERTVVEKHPLERKKRDAQTPADLAVGIDDDDVANLSLDVAEQNDPRFKADVAEFGHSAPRDARWFFNRLDF
jgi:hypothetical protein